jgi:hypothetical protein
MIETYILFGAAIFGIGWLLGNYTKDKEKADYTMFIIDSLIQNRFLRTHPIEILPRVFVKHIIRWDTPKEHLKNPVKLEEFHFPKNFTNNLK